MINKKIVKIFVVLLVFVIVFTAATSIYYSDSLIDKRNADDCLDSLLVKYVTDQNGQVNRNAVISIEAPAYKYFYRNACGVARDDTKEPMTVDHQFSIASVTKTMTAAVIMQLWEEGALGNKGLDTPLADLNIFPIEVINSLHNIDGVSYGKSITIRHLLNQTSGLKNYFDDDKNGVGADYPELREYAPDSLNGFTVFDKDKGLQSMMHYLKTGNKTDTGFKNFYLTYEWSPWNYDAWKQNSKNKMSGLLNYYLSGANQTSLWKPGSDFHYSDTNYLLLGLVIENLTGKSLHEAFRQRIFDPLKMNHTYLQYSKKPGTKPYETKLSDNWGFNFPLYSNGVNFSSDWGGGGVISTASDLNTFIRALAKGKLFRNTVTFKEMVQTPENIDSPYALGVVVWPFDDGYIIYHSGANGSWMEYNSKLDISITGTVNDRDQSYKSDFLRKDIYKVLLENGLESKDLMSLVNSIGFESRVQDSLPMLETSALLLSIFVFVCTLILWFFGLFSKREKTNTQSLVILTKWLSIVTIILNLVFIISFVMNIMEKPYQMAFGFTALVRYLQVLTVFSAILTLCLIPLSIIMWKYKNLSIPAKIHHTILSASFIVYLYIVHYFYVL